MRLNKYIAHYSSYSRREADRAIEAGYVRINGEITTDLATQVDEKNDDVWVSGKQITPTDKYTVIVYNKNKGEIVSKKDPEGRKTIYDTLDAKYKHFIPVGRLDYASEGLLLLTDASKIAAALMESNLTRTYKIKIKGLITPVMEEAMQNGITLLDATKGAHAKSKITSMSFAPFAGYKIHKNRPDFSVLKVSINEGQNREVRRFFAHFGADVADLKRVSFGHIELNALPSGKTRFLSRSEYSTLFELLKEFEKEQKLLHLEAKPEVQKDEKRVPKREHKSEEKKSPKRFQPIKNRGAKK